MDCFLIKDCLWNEEAQIAIVRQIINGAIEQHGYKLQIDFNNLKDDLDEFKEEIKEETKFVKDTRVEKLMSPIDEYYELINPPSRNGKYIKKGDYEQLTAEKLSIYLGYDHYNSIRDHTIWQVKKGKDEFHISVNDIECKLKTIITGDERHITKKPHIAVEESWDKKVKQYLGITAQQRDELEQYRSKDLEYLRTNIFVNPVLANIVESHLTKTQEEIGKYEVEIRRIQKGYKELKNEEIIIE